MTYTQKYQDPDFDEEAMQIALEDMIHEALSIMESNDDEDCIEGVSKNE